MKVTVFSDRYPPTWCAGSEMMLHEILVELSRRGHSIDLFVRRETTSQYGGVYVRPYSRDGFLRSAETADVVFSQLGEGVPPLVQADALNKPTVYFQHINNDVGVARLPRRTLLVCNSQTMRGKVRREGPTTVLYPPINAEYYATTPGDAVTLINMNRNKGGHLFWQLAAAMPDRQFLGVRGSYGSQITRKPLPNVTVLPHTPDIRSVYARTRLLLLPSEDESWGRVLIEAGASGIPSIASDIPNVREALNGSGVLVRGRELRPWVQAIEAFDDAAHYAKFSQLAQQRAAQLSTPVLLDTFEKEIVEHVANFDGMTRQGATLSRKPSNA